MRAITENRAWPRSKSAKFPDGAESCVDDPELTREGQSSVPETLRLLRQKLERTSTSVQDLRDPANTLERPTHKTRATAITNKIPRPPRTKPNITKR